MKRVIGMNRVKTIPIAMVGFLAASAASPCRVDAQSSSEVTASGAGTYPTGAQFEGVTLRTIRFGKGVLLPGDASAAGSFQATLVGTSATGQPQNISIDGVAAGGRMNDDRSVTFSGTGTVDMGDGSAPRTGQALEVTLTTQSDGLGTVALKIGATALPEAAATEGRLTNVTNGQVTLSKLRPTVSWANPADMTNPTALGSAQLNATASVAGTFAYSPAAGTALPAGDGQSIAVAFTPADAANYTATSKTVPINVLARIDVVPGGTNYVSLTVTSKSNSIQAAFLSTPSFDATKIDPATVTLGNGDGNDTKVATNTSGLRASVLDVNLDGRADLNCFFDKQQMLNNGDLTPSTTQFVMTGKTVQRTVRGKDAAVITP